MDWFRLNFQDMPEKEEMIQFLERSRTLSGSSGSMNCDF